MNTNEFVTSPWANEIVQHALAGNAGPRTWREFKAEQARELEQLCDQSPRMTLLALDLGDEFRAAYGIVMPVPCRPEGDQLRLRSGAVFHLRYPEEWRWQAPRGYEPLGVPHPPDLFGPNMISAPLGGVCLGQIPAGITVREIALLGYFAVSLQSHQLNERDPDGILNPVACEFFRAHPEWLPLTHAGLKEEWSPAESPFAASFVS